ncbi:hypothetical protein NQZ68_033914 [Dissostichus eleginoides]|nr:hypothetical protein NQZ68_033914 [Dissostichus eleginoides]
MNHGKKLAMFCSSSHSVRLVADGVGWQGSRFAGPPGSIKRNKAGRRSSAKTPEIKDQVWDWDSLQKAGPILLVQGVSGS